MKTKDYKKIHGLEGYTNKELAESLVFPSSKPSPEQLKAESAFWQQRRAQFEGRSDSEKILSSLLQLKFQLTDYVESNTFDGLLNFGYFLNEYVSRQEKQDKVFAAEVDVKPDVLSQYINNHRKPTDKFVIRLELHSNGMIPAIYWYRLLQKDKEFDIMTNTQIRQEESKHVKNRLQFSYT